MLVTTFISPLVNYSIRPKSNTKIIISFWQKKWIILEPLLTNEVWIINYKHELGIFLFQSVKYVCYLLTATSCLQIKSDITGSLWGCFMVIEGALT